MTKIPYEIPAEIRDLTAKSVEDARKAFGSFIEAAHKATAQAEGTANALQSSAKDVSAKALSFTEANLKGIAQCVSREFDIFRTSHFACRRKNRVAELMANPTTSSAPPKKSSSLETWNKNRPEPKRATMGI